MVSNSNSNSSMDRYASMMFIVYSLFQYNQMGANQNQQINSGRSEVVNTPTRLVRLLFTLLDGIIQTAFLPLFYE